MNYLDGIVAVLGFMATIFQLLPPVNRIGNVIII